jgi:Calcineurin-like phosphoesterase superfamily domain
MNRVAVITDIHANMAALEATLSELEALSVDAVYCGGDLVGYGPNPNDVCALIEARGIPTIYATTTMRSAETPHAQALDSRLRRDSLRQLRSSRQAQ